MSTPLALTSAVTEALVRVLPTGMPLEPAICSAAAAPAGRVMEAVTASFVGATSADLALVLSQPNSLGSAAGIDSPLISGHDVLRPALEAAAAVLGAGVLADSRVEDASTIFTDPTTSVYELTSDGAVTGWFAIRLRSNGVVGGDGRRATDSVTGKLGRINNVEMSLTVEIGRARMSVRDVLSLEPGAVIELDRSAGAPADVLLNGRLIAHGEIVVVDQDYAVRITKILDVAEVLR